MVLLLPQLAAMQSPPKPKGTPPSLEIIEGLAALGVRSDEVQELYSLRGDYMKRPEVAEAMTRGFARLKTNLRSWQMKCAESGHPALLIWLGKQYLGQADRFEQSVTGSMSHMVLDSGMLGKLQQAYGETLKVMRGEPITPQERRLERRAENRANWTPPEWMQKKLEGKRNGQSDQTSQSDQARQDQNGS